MIVMFSNSSRTCPEYVNLTHARYVILVWIMPRILYDMVLSASIVFVERGHCLHEWVCCHIQCVRNIWIICTILVFALTENETYQWAVRYPTITANLCK